MKWEGNRESDNVEDRRGSGGGGGGLLGGRSVGIGTIVVALLGGWIFGINPLTILGLLSGEGAPTAQVQPAPAQRPPADDRMAKFVSTVLADTEDVWRQQFSQGVPPTASPGWCCFVAPPEPPVGKGRRPWGRFIAPATRRCTSIWASMKP
jgi:predicted metalloprotease